jgi:hypothetical protein
MRTSRLRKTAGRADRATPRRDAENELYDLGSDLVEAATAISRYTAEADPDAAGAIPALLGCIETALEELSAASAALHRANAAPSVHDARSQAAVDRLERGYANLSVALQDARAASRAARSLAARCVQHRH